MERSNKRTDQRRPMPFVQPKPDEIDFSQFGAYPNMCGDKDWLLKVWNDQQRIESGDMEPLRTRSRPPLFARGGDQDGIREVWAHNLDDEFRIINTLIAKYPYVAMDTEFPGVVMQPYCVTNPLYPKCSFQYQLIRCNVDALRIIQLGLTFMDEHGNTPPGPCHTWQFNFKFNLSTDLSAESSIRLLQRSGVQFEKLPMDGIDPSHFAELLIGSGLVMMDNVTWISFHSSYDFGYLLKLLTNKNLPIFECEFFETLKLYFPNIYDVKFLMHRWLKGGLQDLAEHFKIQRRGIQHQAGSDAHLTGQVFFKVKELYFGGEIDPRGQLGYLYGLDYSTTLPGYTGAMDIPPQFEYLPSTTQMQ